MEPKEASDNAGLEGPEEMPRFGLAGRLGRAARSRYIYQLLDRSVVSMPCVTYALGVILSPSHLNLILRMPAI